MIEELTAGAMHGGMLEKLALADWLDEHGESDRANRLRGAAPTIDLPLIGNHTMRFAWVPPGESWLGGGSWDEAGIQRNPEPGHKPFTLEKPLWCGIYPVTQAEWEAVTGNNPSRFKNNPTHPVESVSWDDLQAFLEKVNHRPGSGLLYRLPTEEEWEYICRGGPITKEDSKYDFTFATSLIDLKPVGSNDLSSKQANFNGGHPAGNAERGYYLKRTTRVGSYLLNPLGIYDMHGNVWEWTSTREGLTRVVRGGSWYNGGRYCTAAGRCWDVPTNLDSDLGFRLLAAPAEE